VTSRLRVLIVDDHPIVRQGLKQTLIDAADMGELGEASTAQEALSCSTSGCRAAAASTC
jgi:YesN/AraC family two-component response regulator